MRESIPLRRLPLTFSKMESTSFSGGEKLGGHFLCLLFLAKGGYWIPSSYLLCGQVFFSDGNPDPFGEISLVPPSIFARELCLGTEAPLWAAVSGSRVAAVPGRPKLGRKAGRRNIEAWDQVL